MGTNLKPSTFEYILDKNKEKIVDNVIDWVCTRLEEFNFSDPYDSLHFKATTELLFMCGLYKKKYVRSDERIERIISHVMKVLDTTKHYEMIPRRPSFVLPYATIYSSLHECGYDLHPLDEIIQTSIDSGYVTVMECPSSQKMDLCYTLTKGGFKHAFPKLKELYEKTILSKNPPILHIPLDDIYAITHIIFYLTDFGFAKSDLIPTKDLESIKWVITNLIGFSILQKNWDTLGELLLCCDLMDYYPSPLYELGWEKIINSQLSDGCVPSPFFEIKKYENMDETTKKAYYFEQNYHSTLVAAIAAFLSKKHEERSLSTIDFRAGQELPLSSMISSCAMANRWLVELSHNLPANHIVSFLYVLMGKWIYNNGIECKDLSFLVKRISSIFEECRKLNIDPLTDCDPSLILISAGILRKLDCSIPEFETFVRDSYDAINSYTPNTVDDELRILPIRYILNILYGKDQRYDHTNIIKSISCQTFDDKSFRNISSLVSSLTLSGTKIPELLPSEISDIVPLMEIQMLYSLYRYDLETGPLLLRTMNHLGIINKRSFVEGINFLLSQQRPDGSFGFFHDEITRIKKINPQYDEIIDLRLPITVSSLWTNAEIINHEFSLFNSIR